MICYKSILVLQGAPSGFSKCLALAGTSQHWLALVGTGRWGSQGEWALEETVGDQVETRWRLGGDQGETKGSPRGDRGSNTTNNFCLLRNCWEALTMLNL